MSLAFHTTPHPWPCRTVTVIGLGNPLRTDDGVGHAVARRLWHHPWGALPVRVEAVRHLLVEHVDLVRDAGHVVFLDAAVDLPPGAWDAAEIAPVDAGAASFHALAPGVLLALAGAIHGSRPPATLVRIGVADLQPGEGLSAALAARLDECCDAIQRLVEERALALCGPGGHPPDLRRAHGG